MSKLRFNTILGAMVIMLDLVALHAVAGSGSATPSTLTTLDVLIAFRKAITADPAGALSSWSTAYNQSNANYCSWEGVVCHTGTQQVKGIQLGGRKLQGHITPLLGKLPSLSYLNLSFNHLSGMLPEELGKCTSLSELAINDNQLISGSLPREFANLTRLQVLSAGGNNLTGDLPPLPLPLLHHLNLSTNTIGGQLTTQLAGCNALRVLDLSSNAFQGSIPASLGNFSHLAYLDLAFNTFSSGLPPSLANCTRLSHLNLYTNHLSGTIPESWFPQFRHHLAFFSLGNNGCNGSVPSSIASLSKLEYIELGGNHFNGQILHNLLNCTSLSVLDLWTNSFSERLPANLGTALPHLTVLGLILNSFYGNIPVSLGNCSQLQVLIMGFNYGITGTIPKELFGLHEVSQLDLQHNALTGNIPPEIGNTSSLLIKLLLNNNQFKGSLPAQLGLLPALQQLNFEFNQFSGGIPRELSNCTHLFLITGNRNLLQGSIPFTLGYLSKLEHLILDNNQLSGEVPASLANCTRLTNVSLNNNLLEGPMLAARLPNMLYLDMSNNRLSGSIPDPQLGSMTQVQLMDLSFNNLTGSIPASLALCINLYYLNLSSNHLSGSIPSNLAASLASLLMLNLSRNSLSGTIPSEIGHLTSLQKLDLSYNSLSGSIPSSLSDLSSLSFLNVSYNNLEGEVPHTGPFHSFSPASFLGNPGLCGLEVLHIPCPHDDSSHNSHALIISLIVAAAVVLIAVLALTCISSFSPTAKRVILSIMCSCCKRFDENPKLLKAPFLRLTLKEIQEATDNFSPANVLGEGGTGVVYKGYTKDGKALAFKKLHLPRNSPMSPFFAEIRSMGQVRHRNLARILGYFSDLEYDILILEYMPNGNLSQHLHSATASQPSSPSHKEKPMTIESSAAEADVVLDYFDHDHALSWPQRLRLAEGIAAGLAYLHHDCPAPIIHLDIKPTNILLDENLEARITDFGLARVMQETAAASMSASTQNMRGSLGYVAPEYANMGKISRKCDVYSFGIVLLEMLTGKSPTDDVFTQGATLASWVLSLKIDNGQFQEHLVKLCMGGRTGVDDDGTLQREQVNGLLEVAVSCTKENPKERPTMQKVVETLAGINAEAGAALLSLSQKDYLKSLLS